MTTEYRFYQLGRTGLARALMGILPKALERGLCAHILCASAERLSDLNNRLWTEDPNSFLPHGAAGDGSTDLEQPILLSTSDGPPANGAKLLILTDGADTAQVELYDLICVMMDGGDEAALASGRAIWSRAKTAGNAASYWVQDPASGGWKQEVSS